MKAKLFALAAMAIMFMSCENDLQKNYLYITPTEDSAMEAIHPDISVWAEGIDNALFTYVKTIEGKLCYRSVGEVPQISGRVMVLMPYNASASIESEQIKLSLPKKQAAHPLGASYAGLTTAVEGEVPTLSLKQATVGINIDIVGKPESLDILSLTLRLIPEENRAPKIINLDATINPSTGKATATTDRTLTAVSCYGEQLLLNIFGGDYSSTTFQFELILSDHKCYVWTENGLTISRNRTYTLDFASNGMFVYEAFPVDNQYHLSAGIPQRVGFTDFAPQNLGYDEELHPYGLYFSKDSWIGKAYNGETESTDDFSYLQDAWRLPTKSELESLISQGSSDLWLRTQSIGYWIGQTAESTPNDGKNLYLQAAGMINSTGKQVYRTERACYMTAEGDVLVITDEGYSFEPITGESAVSVMLVKK